MIRFLDTAPCIHCRKRVSSYWLVTDTEGGKHVVCAPCMDMRRPG